MIQTVTGALCEQDVGVVLMHEHLSCASVAFSRAFGSLWLDTQRLRELSRQTLSLVQEKYGLGMLVDATPMDLGRDATLLYEVSRATGIPIVASAGFYYLPSVETVSNDPDEIADWLLRECRYGMEGTDIKPGILKCATGPDGITPDNRTKLEAIGMVQGRTGLALYVHCDHRGDIARQQIDLLTASGAAVTRIIIGHSALRPEYAYLKEILESGCYVAMDQCHCCHSRIRTIADTLVRLCKDGYTDRILLSNDYCIHNDFAKKREDGLERSPRQHAEVFGYIFDTLYPMFLECGGEQADWDTMLCKNPIAALSV